LAHPKLNLFWPLRLIAASILIAPALLFSYATWQNWTHVNAEADLRIERSLDVLQEHALKGLQTIERSMAEINEVLRGRTDAEIRAAEPDLYLRFKRTHQALPQIGNMWAFDADGRPLVSSVFMPVPPQPLGDRQYFTVQKEADVGTYISEILPGRLNTLSFFVVSARRTLDDSGRFNGIISVSVMPEHFSEFYRKLSRGQDSFALLKEDGSVLARYPELKLGQTPPKSELSAFIAANPQGGLLTARSTFDDVERRTGYRKVPGFPVYVESGVETAAISAAFWTTVGKQVAMGLPVVLAMFALAVYGLYRAERFQEETDRREAAESALKQAQRLEAIGQLTGGVAHDFNNLLMVVAGNADRLRRHLVLDDRNRRALESIELAVKRGADLTRQLLSFARRQTHETKIVDLRERLPVIQTMLQSSLRGDIAVNVSVAPDLWPAKIDLGEFELALLNMAVNARDAMAGGGRLTITAANTTLRPGALLDLSGDFITITVADTGVGIPPDVLARVFEPFFTTKDVGKGTGLGLSQVYGFAQQAGGAAVIASTVGKGTTVTLYLPRAAEAPAQVVLGEAPRPTSSDRLFVLLVEDNAEVANVARGYLEGFGHVVHTAPNVSAAQSLLETNQPRVDVVLSDIVMPGGADGLDLARWIKRTYGPRLPVILATGYSDKAQTATDEGFTLLRKPYTANDLHTALTNAVRPPRAKEVA
jgi:two-component system NtrC family sensor kinase